MIQINNYIAEERRKELAGVEEGEFQVSGTKMGRSASAVALGKEGLHASLFQKQMDNRSKLNMALYHKIQKIKNHQIPLNNRRPSAPTVHANTGKREEELRRYSPWGSASVMQRPASTQPETGPPHNSKHT